MIVFEFLKIIPLVLLCVYASITDIKYGIIENKTVLTASIIGICLDVFGWFTFNREYIKDHMISIFAVAALSIIFYALHIWAGGDCKLMIAIALLMPYELYIPISNGRMSLVLLLAIVFGISYIYLIGESIVLAVKTKKLIGKEKLINNAKRSITRWISSIAYITLFDQIFLRFFPEMFFKTKFLVLIINICLAVIVSGISILCNKFVVAVVIFSGIVIRLICHQPILNKFMLINYLLAIAFIILRIFIDEYNREIIETAKVEKGMILSAATTVQFALSKVKGLPPQSTEDLRSRLTEEEAESVRRWGKSKYGMPSVEIIRKIPFAIFISIGTFLFLIVGAVMR